RIGGDRGHSGEEQRGEGDEATTPRDRVERAGEYARHKQRDRLEDGHVSIVLRWRGEANNTCRMLPVCILMVPARSALAQHAFARQPRRTHPWRRLLCYQPRSVRRREG